MPYKTIGEAGKKSGKLCFQVLEITEIKVETKTNYGLNFGLVFPIMWMIIDISAVII